MNIVPCRGLEKATARRSSRIYFSYNNTLSHRKKASVYANVVRNKEGGDCPYLHQLRGWNGKICLARAFRWKVWQRYMALLLRRLSVIKWQKSSCSYQTDGRQSGKSSVYCGSYVKEPGARTVIVHHEKTWKKNRRSAFRMEGLMFSLRQRTTRYGNRNQRYERHGCYTV